MWVVGVLMKPANSRERYEVIGWSSPGMWWWNTMETRSKARELRDTLLDRAGLGIWWLETVKIWDRKRREFIT